MRTALLPFLLFACAHPLADDSRFEIVDSGEPPVVEEPLVCNSRVAWLQPEAGSLDVAVDEPIEIGLTEPLPEGARWRVHIDGTKGQSELTSQRKRISWMPDAPLPHDARVELVVELCDTVETFELGTRGRPIDTEDLLRGQWPMRPNEASWLAPAMATVFLPLVDFGIFGFYVDDTPDGLHLLAEITPPSAYGSCTEVVDLGKLDLDDNPQFSTRPRYIEISLDGATLTVAQAQITGTFAAEGERIEDLSLRGLVDVRPFEDDDVAICDIARLSGETCVACPDGENACLFTLLTMPDIGQVDSHGRANCP